MIIEEPRRPKDEVPGGEIHCGKCGVLVKPDHPYSWCSACGDPFPQDIQARLPRLQSALQEGAQKPRTTQLVVEGRAVPCPICAHDRYWTRETVMVSRGAAFFNVEWASKGAVNYVCDRCGHVLWFARK